MNYNIEIKEFISSTHPNFWNAFNEYAREDGRFLKVFKSLYNNKESRYEFPLGPNNTHIALTRFLRNNNILIDFHTLDKELFDKLYLKKGLIEKELGLPLQWQRKDDKKATKICYEKIFYNTDKLYYIFDWLIEYSIKFKQVFSKYAELDTYKNQMKDKSNKKIEVDKCNNEVQQNNNNISDSLYNYVEAIAKVNKEERYKAIINILEENNIEYKIQKIQGYQSLGNIIVESKSKNLGKIVVSAHYDNAPGTPGANDNAAACSILLNILINNKENNTNKNIEYVFFDLEEKGAKGSEYYVQVTKNISYALNFDMCGTGENIVCANYNLNNQILENIKDIYNNHDVKVVNDIPYGDAYTFRDKNIKTFYIINSTDNDLTWFNDFPKVKLMKTDFGKTIHKINDTIDKVNFNQVEKIYNFVLDLLNKI